MAKINKTQFPTHHESDKLRKNVVSVIAFRCRDIGYGVEEGVIEGFWTGAIDTWGKHTIRLINDDSIEYYLFPDEIVSVDEY